MKLLVDASVFIASFDKDSKFRSESIDLLEELSKRRLIISMPAHGWFEVQCTLQRLSREQKFIAPTIDRKMNYPIELIHIDKAFIEKYAGAKIPYIKAGDHIFIAVAKVNNFPLITRDKKMCEISRECGVRVFTPPEYLKSLKAAT